MISKFEELNGLFEELDNALTEKIRFYIIGGAVMLYHGLKVGTKDIDIVVDSPREFIAAEKALKKIRFYTRIPAIDYKKFDINQIFIRGDFRIDLFQRTVCKGFQLSEAMKNRAKKIKEMKNLAISLCSITDIFMFKTFTEREGDIADCISLTRGKVDWDSMLEEIKGQIRVSGDKIWITWIGERMDMLLERGLRIPIMEEINRLRIEYFDEYDKKSTKQIL